MAWQRGKTTQSVVSGGVYHRVITQQSEECFASPDSSGFTGMIGFDTVRDSKRSGSRMQGCLVNAPCESIGANTKRADFALAA